MAEKKELKGAAKVVIYAMVAVVVVCCIVLVGIIVGSTGSGSSDSSSAAPAGDAGQAPAEQVFNTEVATATYRDKTEPTPGNAMYNFALENKTGSTVMVGAENIVLNGGYSVQSLTGSATPIAPGTKGSVSLTFGYSVQTDLEKMDDISTLSCDLVMRDNSTFDVIGTVHVDVQV